MKKEQLITVEEYINQLNKKTQKINQHGKSKKFWRVVSFFLAIAVCGGCVVFGINTKAAHLKEQYQKYCQEQDRTMLDSQLLEYRDTLQIFEQTSLGNNISQTQMGGFFYNDGSISIYPDIETGHTQIKIGGQTKSLSDSFASDINVFDNNVYFKDTGSMDLMKYDISTQVSSKVGLEGVGHFIVCDGMIVFKDTMSGELKLFREGSDPELISSGKIVSFSIAGNQIIYLQDDYTLHSINISTKTDEIISGNVNSFFYDGKLWIQNNTEIYMQSLEDKNLSTIAGDEECRRILGITSDYLIFDGTDAICVYNLNTQMYMQLSTELVFVGASDNGQLLVYSLDMGTYQIIGL